MAIIGRKSRNSRKEQNKNVLITRSPNNSKNSRNSRNSRNQDSSRNFNSSRNLNGSRKLNGPGSSMGSRRPKGSKSSRLFGGSGNAGTIRKPRSPKQILLMVIILIAFICGLALGISMIMGIGEPDVSDSGDVQYMNVTKNITAYENSSYDLQDENGTQISYYDFEENVTEGQNITAFNSTNSANIY